MSGDILITITYLAALVVSGWLIVREYKRRKYQKVKDDIFNYVKSYKNRCTGHNKFVISVEILQDIFREYDTETIERVFRDLINEKVLSQNEFDKDWCIQ